MTTQSERPVGPSDEAVRAAAEAMYSWECSPYVGRFVFDELSDSVKFTRLYDARLMLETAYAIDGGRFDAEAVIRDPAKQVTRLEVIDHRHGAPSIGRVFSAWDCRIELSYQDDGRTLKVFVDGDATTGNGPPKWSRAGAEPSSGAPVEPRSRAQAVRGLGPAARHVHGREETGTVGLAQGGHLLVRHVG